MIASLFTFWALALAAAAPAAEAPAETFIPYAGSDGIVEWKVAADDAIYLRSIAGGWYLVRTMGPCRRMRAAVSLGFVTSHGDELDRYGSILAGGRRCPLVSVLRSGPPAQRPAR